MGADNWGICPQCKVNANNKRKDLENRLVRAYGVLPEKEYLALRDEVNKPDEEPKHTLREDYEIGIDEDGLFSVNYRSSCEVCGFQYKYRYEAAAVKQLLL